MPEKSWKEIIEESKKAAPSYDPIPNDEYDYVISKAEATKTANGKDMYKVQAKVIHGDHARRVVFHNFVVSYDSPVAMSIFLRQMSILGLDEAYFSADPSVDKVAADLVGKVFRGRTEIGEWNGQPKNEIKNFATASAEARQLALSVPTSANPNPAASPTANSGVSGAPVPSPSTPPAPAAPAVPTPSPETVAAPPVAPPAAPAAPPIPPPPPAPQF